MPNLQRLSIEQAIACPCARPPASVCRTKRSKVPFIRSSWSFIFLVDIRLEHTVPSGRMSTRVGTLQVARWSQAADGHKSAEVGQRLLNCSHANLICCQLGLASIESLSSFGDKCLDCY